MAGHFITVALAAPTTSATMATSRPCWGARHREPRRRPLSAPSPRQSCTGRSCTLNCFRLLLRGHVNFTAWLFSVVLAASSSLVLVGENENGSVDQSHPVDLQPLSADARAAAGRTAAERAGAEK